MNSRVLRLLRVTVLGLFALSSCSAIGTTEKLAQWQSDSMLITSYDFVNVASDTICDPSHSLAPFYDALRQLKAGGMDMMVVPIIHYGDSHIQGGVLTQTIMRHFASQFGTAGRGMVVPHRLSGKNEPRDFVITSPRSHKGATIIDSRAELSFGVSGVSVQAPAPLTYVLRTLSLDNDTIDYRFNRIVVFHDSLAPMITTARDELLDEDGGSDIFRPFTTEINLLELTDSIALKTYREPPFESGAIFGFALENGRSGVIYHSMGVNGACFLHFGRSANLAVQSSVLNPKLIIVSLGSNEASGKNFLSSVFESQMDSFVERLRVANPTTPILLTTPAQVMRRTRSGQVPNRNFEAVSRSILDYGLRHGIAVFDLYAATGGEGSVEKWRDEQMLSGDGIHFTEKGYTLQGVLIYNALMSGLFR